MLAVYRAGYLCCSHEKLMMNNASKGLLTLQVRAEATAAARREVDSQVKAVEKGKEEIRALQDQVAQAQQSNTKQAHLLAVQTADLDARSAKIAKQEVQILALYYQ